MKTSIWICNEFVTMQITFICRSFNRYAFSKYDMETYLKIPGPPLEPILGNARPIAGSLRKLFPVYLGTNDRSVNALL